MLVGWWVVTIELPGKALFHIVAQRVVERALPPISVWAFGLTQAWMSYRFLALCLIIVAVFFHRFLWMRRVKWDVYGKWLFKSGFLLFYIVLYAFFLLNFLAMEWPLRSLPTR